MPASFQLQITPVNIHLKKKERVLEVEFDDGSFFIYTAEYLRVESPSAEVKGHGSSQKRIIPGRRDVGITTIEMVGNYALRIIFDDKHDTGIYSWCYLHELGEKYNDVWHRYLKMLDSLGLSRNP